MDRVRFGRALGRGARLAARTALEAADAATAASPQTGQSSKRAQAASPAEQRTVRKRPVLIPPAFGNAVKAARVGVAAPLREASSALWHELTGCFFALFAFSFGVGVWHTRALARSGIPADRYRFAFFCVLTLLFAYFSVSNFLRARRRTAR